MTNTTFIPYPPRARYTVIQLNGKHTGRHAVVIGERPGGMLVIKFRLPDKKGKARYRNSDILPRNVQRIGDNHELES